MQSQDPLVTMTDIALIACANGLKHPLCGLWQQIQLAGSSRPSRGMPSVEKGPPLAAQDDDDGSEEEAVQINVDEDGR
jgi:hypothetical protein